MAESKLLLLLILATGTRSAYPGHAMFGSARKYLCFHSTLCGNSTLGLTELRETFVERITPERQIFSEISYMEIILNFRITGPMCETVVVVLRLVDREPAPEFSARYSRGTARNAGVRA